MCRAAHSFGGRIPRAHRGTRRDAARCRDLHRVLREPSPPHLRYARPMPFEIRLPRRIDVYTLRCAGMETDEYFRRSEAADDDDDALPFDVRLPYFLADPPATVNVTVLEVGKVVRLRVAGPDARTERKIRSR